MEVITINASVDVNRAIERSNHINY